MTREASPTSRPMVRFDSPTLPQGGLQTPLGRRAVDEMLTENTAAAKSALKGVRLF